MNNAINKKLIRDLRHMGGQVLATSLVVACGIASFVAMRSTYTSLRSSQDSYYSEYRFADIFAGLKRAPEHVRTEIESIPGVAEVQTRVVNEVSLTLPNTSEPAQARLVSIPPRRASILNDLHIVRGSYIDQYRPDDVIVSEAFANANGFQPGDRIEAILNGRRRRLTICGIALSPEYIYEIRPGDIFPDNRRYGVLWINRDEAAAAFRMDGAFNDLSIRLAPNAHGGSVIDTVDRILAEYGGLGAFEKADQQSYRFLSNEFSQLRAFGVFLPAVFLGVTAFLLHLVLSRVVRTQREQIGLLKAFGYTKNQIAAHYLLFALACVIAGTVLGIAGGMWLGYEMTLMYADYFRFPVLDYEAGWGLIVSAVLISLTASSAGAFSSLITVSKLPPAESMRPEPPQSFRTGWFEKLGLQKRFSPANRITLRNLARQKMKSFAGAIGISFAVALLFTGFYFFDAIDRVVEVQFHKAIREDVIVSFHSPQPGIARHEVLDLPGVQDAEFFRSVPARLRNGFLEKRVAVLGSQPASQLHRIVDKDGIVHSPPRDGIMLSRELSRQLQVDVGDEIQVEVLEGKRKTGVMEVVRTVDEILGTNAYVEISSLNNFLDEDDLVSGAYLSVRDDEIDALYKRLRGLPSVAGVGLPGVVLKGFQDTFARTIGSFTFFLVLFSSAIVFGVVYNAARIALSERGRELASLRVLGFTKRETAQILLGEQVILTILALPPGYLMGVALCYLMNNLVDRDLMRLPVIFGPRTVVLTAVLVAAASLFSGLIVARRVRSLDMIEVLKTRE